MGILDDLKAEEDKLRGIKAPASERNADRMLKTRRRPKKRKPKRAKKE
ncbi:hypothetical protein ACGYJ8_15405 [Sulfitobacter sp. 1A12126]